MPNFEHVRKRTWEVVSAAKHSDAASRVFDLTIISLIFLNLAAIILETVHPIHEIFYPVFRTFEVASVIIFTLEYLVRLWSCTVDQRYRRPFLGRLRFALTPLTVIDLLAVLPFYLSHFVVDLLFLRALRLFRIIRVAKLGRYMTAVKLIGSVFRAKREELILISAVMFLLIVVSSCLMYVVENPAQPEKFTDIPTTMWWAVSTLTTVGYGDIYPVTGIGKLLGAVVAVLGIAFFALPTGILGSGFIEEVHKRRESRKCPHCGRVID
jgi:voltage-gated potassium channel